MGGGFNSIRDIIESAASLAGNYLLPGSSAITDHFVSKGSQGQLGSLLGQVAQAGTGLTGAGIGSSITGIPSASSIGAGYTNAANALGGVGGDPTLGTDISNGASNLGNSVSNSLSGLLSGNPTTPSLVDANSALTGSTALGSSPSFGANISSAGQAFPAPSLGTTAGLASNALGAGVGGGSSSYALPGALLGAANSLYSNYNAQQDLTNAQKNANAQLEPFLASGTSANSQLSDLLGTSGNTSASGYGSLTQPFTPGDLTQTPGYQFDLTQGQQALQRQQAATGNSDSGAALKSAEDYGTGLADNTYNTALQNYNTQQNNTYSKLAGAAGTGLSAGNAIATGDENIGSAQANAGISSSNILNQTLSSLLSGTGAKKPVNVGGQVVYM